MAAKKTPVRLQLIDVEGAFSSSHSELSVFLDPPGVVGCAECVVSLLSNARVT